MEISNLIKIISNYVGQRIKKTYGAFPPNEFGNLILTPSTIADADFYEGNHIRSDCKLILKPLSAITDEDSIEVCKLQQEFKGQNGIKVGFDIDIKNNGCLDCLIEWDGYKHDYFQPVYSPTYQYLQLKGYDLPNYLLGGKTLHEAGLCIYE